MEKNLISVIVPIYNVEEYLNKCVQSIVNQTYKNLEIILVDDGSSDNCPVMCDEWAKKDDRIRVIHKKNGGLSDARNVGLSVAKGAFIGFVDSDDWIDLDFYDVLYREIKKNKSDIVVGGIIQVWSDNSTKLLTENCKVTINNHVAMENIITEKLLKQPVWYKLYQRDVANIKFVNGKIHEDVFWSYQAIAKANRVSIVNNTYYYYRQREQSIMSSEYSIKNLSHIEAKIERLDFVKNRYPDLYDIGNIDLLFTIYYHGDCVIHFLKGDDRKSALCFLKDTIKKYPIGKKSYYTMKPTHKLWVILSQHFFILGCHLRHFLKIG